MQLHSLWALLLLILLPPLAYLMLRKKRTAAVKFSSLVDIKNCPVSWRLRFRPLLVAARLLCLVLLIIALARPRKGTILSEIATEGVAIEVVADHSGSMQTEMDYYGQNLSRFEVVKKVFADFVIGDKKELSGRSSDLIGLIVFARYADTVCPLVLGHNVLLEFLKKTDVVNMRNEDGTAIGDAIALASARLQKCEDELQQRRKKLALAGDKFIGADEGEFKIKSKVIILLTDGCNNTGMYDPMEAAELAKKWGIKIYTVGIGSGQAYTTVQTIMGSFKMPAQQEIDEALLKKIADTTGGFYGRAGDAESLHQIVQKIDSLEKTKVKSVQYIHYAERFGPWTLAALLVLTSEMLANCTIFRKIP